MKNKVQDCLLNLPGNMNKLLSEEEINRIISGRHPSPHSILGNHRITSGEGDSIIIRAFCYY